MKSSLVLTALALALVSATSLRAGAVLTIAPQTQTIAAGSAAQVQVRIAGLGLHTAPSLGAFDFDLSFNPALVAFTSLTFGDPVLGDQLDLSGTGSINSFGLQSAGLLEFFEISLDPASVLDSQQASGFVLATLSFQALAKGTTSLVPSLNSTSDSQGMPLNVGLSTGSITVVTTPEPRTIGLLPLVGAWIALGSMRCKRRAFKGSTAP